MPWAERYNSGGGSEVPREKSFDEALAGAKRMSENYVARNKRGYKFYPDPEVVEAVQVGLAQNELKYGRRYCP